MTDKNQDFIDDGGDDHDFDASTKPEQPTRAPENVELEVAGSVCSVSWFDPSPPQGIVDKYQISWSLDGESWQQTEKLSQSEIVHLRGQGRMYKMFVGPNTTMLKVRVQLFVQDFSTGSGYSETAVFGVEEDTDLLDIVIKVIIGVVLLIALVLIAVCCARKCNLLQRFPGFKPVPTTDYSQRPIVKNPGPVRSSSLSPSSVSNNSPRSTIEMRDRSRNRGSLGGRRSAFDDLPPVPGEENTYETIPSTSANNQQAVDEDDYLLPNPVKMASVESLDDEGYLKPNFNRVQPFDTKSPSREDPDPIAMVSYSSQDELAK